MNTIHFNSIRSSISNLNLTWLIVFLTFLCLFSSNVFSATQGTEGATSTGTTDIVVVVNELALIKGLNDINLGTWSGSGDLSGDDDICVATTGSLFTNHGYHLRASGDGDAFDPGAFTLSNGTDDIYYRVFLTDVDDTNELLPGQLASGNQFFAGIPYLISTINPGCIFPNATITVLVEEAELQSGAGTHSGVLTLVLIPE